jgi:hypothetical protein
MNRLLSLVCALVIATGVLVIGGGVAAAAPIFQMPFPCGQVWMGQTRTDHVPANAVDFNRAGDDGDSVVAAATGRVVKVENQGGVSYGRWIEIDHGAGWRTRYAHLSQWRVFVGQSVRQGQLIGNVGTTGGSTGPHLHFEQLFNGAAQRIVFDDGRITYWGTRTYTSGNRCGAGNLA